jgi:glycosyltransferase involved in cell wall biosynthesis
MAASEVHGAHLHIVGDGPYRSELEELAWRLQVGEQVTFHGAVTHDMLPDYFRAAELCVMSSRHESLGMSVLEAGACGKSTIGTAVGVLPELQPATRAVPVGDESALAHAIIETLQTPGRTSEMGRRCLAMVARSYTLDTSAAAHTRIYEELIEGRHSGSRLQS